mgnify:CR=1 FL=1
MKRVAIITSSDTGYRGEREDLSGPAIREIVEKNGYEVVSEDILQRHSGTDPDNRRNRFFTQRYYTGGNGGYY